MLWKASIQPYMVILEHMESETATPCKTLATSLLCHLPHAGEDKRILALHVSAEKGSRQGMARNSAQKLSDSPVDFSIP